MGFNITPALPSDAAAIANLHGEALAPGWPASDFEASCGNANRILLKAAEGGDLLGFVLVQFAADEAEILSIAVAKEAQQQGIGSAILAASIAACEQKAITHIYLEVAEGNGAALKLYGKFGFGVLSRRPDYYQAGRSTPETALIMRLETTRAKRP